MDGLRSSRFTFGSDGHWPIGRDVPSTPTRGLSQPVALVGQTPWVAKAQGARGRSDSQPLRDRFQPDTPSEGSSILGSRIPATAPGCEGTPAGIVSRWRPPLIRNAFRFDKIIPIAAHNETVSRTKGLVDRFPGFHMPGPAPAFGLRDFTTLLYHPACDSVHRPHVPSTSTTRCRI